MHVVALHYNPLSTAQRLTELDASMRQDHTRRAAIAARVSFYEAAVRLFALRRLDRLGAIASLSRLSGRSLDLVFEDRRYSAEVLARIVAIAERDGEFRQALIEQAGTVQLAQWRASVSRDQFGRAIAA